MSASNEKKRGNSGDLVKSGLPSKDPAEKKANDE